MCWDETSSIGGGREIILQARYIGQFVRRPGEGGIGFCLSLTLLLILCPDIEELTSKTGNFKQFAVFLNMLESAITKVHHSMIAAFPFASFPGLGTSVASFPGLGMRLSKTAIGRIGAQRLIL